MNLQEKIERALRKNSTRTNGEIAHNMNCKVGDVQEVREALNISGPPGAPSRKRGRGKSVDTFRGKHDVALIIQRKVDDTLTKECEQYFEDQDFRTLCEVPVHSWRRFADSKQFAAYRLKRGGHNLWAPPHIIAQIQKILGIT
tara:strand:- start:428 stop:856 length:429 start_codon:yes stop_codon:yes gene_type:complete